MGAPGEGAWLISYRRSSRCQNCDPCGPVGPVPPNSRLSSLLWQSVQKICEPMLRVAGVVAPFSFSMAGSRLGWFCNSAFVITGCFDKAELLNCGITFVAVEAVDARNGSYPNPVSGVPELLPWQRRHIWYWLGAGFSTLVPSVSLMPAVLASETRVPGASLNTCTCCAAWELWQSAQVA